MKINLTNNAFLKLKYFIEECPAEISGFGKVREIFPEMGDKEFEIFDIEILTQEVGSAHATIDEESLAKFMFEKTKKGESMKEYRLWWHSHNDFQAFFSPIDTGTIDKSTEFPYLISIVSNKDGEMCVRYDEFKPYRFTIEDEDIELFIDDPADERLRQACIKEIARKVKIHTFTPYLDLEEDTPIDVVNSFRNTFNLKHGKQN